MDVPPPPASASFDAPAPVTAATDSTRVLVVFARFPDEETWTQCASPSGWPVPTELPVWADSLFENQAPWDTGGSASHYFDMMSHGKHHVTGHVFHKVVTLDSTIEYYGQEYGQRSVTPAKYDPLRHANQQLLRQMRADPGPLSAASLDANSDGYLDFLWIWYRSAVSTATFTNGGTTFRYKMTLGFSGTADTFVADSVFTFSDSTSLKVGSGTSTFTGKKRNHYLDPLGSGTGVAPEKRTPSSRRCAILELRRANVA